MENEKTLDTLIKNDQKLLSILETVALGDEPRPWERSDFYVFYRESAFRIFGIIAAGMLILLPMKFPTDNSQLLQGSGLSLLPMCIFGQSTQTDKGLKKKGNGK